MDSNKIRLAVDFINQTHQGYGNYFFKKWKRTEKDPNFPVVLLYIAAFDQNEFLKDFYYYMRDLEIDLECGCGNQSFLQTLDESSLKLASFKSLITQLVTDFIKTELLDINTINSSDELMGNL